MHDFSIPLGNYPKFLTNYVLEVIRTFVKLRQLISTHEDLAAKLLELESRYDKQFKIVFEAIREIMSPRIQRIGFGRETEK